MSEVKGKRIENSHMVNIYNFYQERLLDTIFFENHSK